MSPEPAETGAKGKVRVAVISWTLLSLPRMIPMSFLDLLSMPLAVSYLIADGGIETSYSVFPADVIQKIYENRRVLATLIDVCNIADLVIRLAFCLFSNKLYFRFVLKSLRKLRSHCSGELTRAEISQAGGIKLVNALLVVVLSLALTFAAMYATFTLLMMTL